MPEQRGFSPIFIILIAFIFLSLGFGYYLGIQKNTGSAQKTNDLISSSSTNSSGKKYINFRDGQIIVPNGYLATDGTMLTYYGTQGGQAPPKIVLMKDYQLLSSGSSGYLKEIHTEIITKHDNDCISMWSTNGFSSIEDWSSAAFAFEGDLTKKEDIKVGNRQATVYNVATDTGNVYAAFLLIGNEDKSSYYFRTCNTNNKSDFIDVIKSIKFRDDLNLQ